MCQKITQEVEDIFTVSVIRSWHVFLSSPRFSVSSCDLLWPRLGEHASRQATFSREVEVQTFEL